jgi:hypothetical protein
VFVGVAVIAALSVALFGVVDVLGRLAAPWQRAQTQRTQTQRARTQGPRTARDTS